MMICQLSLLSSKRLMGFGKFIIISRHIEDKCNGRTSVKLLEDCFESKVSTDAVDSVQQFLQSKREEIEKQLLTLNKMRVTSGQATKKKSSSTKSTKK